MIEYGEELLRLATVGRDTVEVGRESVADREEDVAAVLRPPNAGSREVHVFGEIAWLTTADVDHHDVVLGGTAVFAEARRVGDAAAVR